MGKKILLITTVLTAGFWGAVLLRNNYFLKNAINEPIVYQIPTPEPLPIKQASDPTPTETKAIKRIEITAIPTPKLKPTINNDPWGVSKQIDEHTWTIRIGEDPKMATPKEIFGALNEYRQIHGSQVLNWDEKLVNYAQSRAVFLKGKKSVDQHAGFDDFLSNQDGFNKLGFTALGENISFGFKLNGVHVIEWMYAGDKPHNDNQLDNRWNYVGVGVDGLATCLIFATGKF